MSSNCSFDQRTVPCTTIVDHGLSGLWRLQADDIGHSALFGPGLAVAPAAVIADGEPLGLLLGAHLFQFLRRRIAAIGLAAGQQFLRHLRGGGRRGQTGKTVRRPNQAHPGQAH